MNNLQYSVFITPVATLLIALLLYWRIWKKTVAKQDLIRFSFLVLIIAFVLNFIWEMLQMPLYEGMEMSVQSVIFCGLASVADAINVLLLYYAFGLIYKETFWIKNSSWIRFSLLVLTGATGAIIIELLHVSFGNWQYSGRMPIIPVVHVGLTPVLQFMILPVVSYYVSSYILNKKFQLLL